MSLITGIRYTIFKDGAPEPGGLLYTYESGTTTPKAVYADAAGTIPLSNPVVMDEEGEAVIFLGTGAYRFLERDSLGVQIKAPVDGILAPSAALSPSSTGAANKNVRMDTTGSSAIVSISADQLVLQNSSNQTLVVDDVVLSVNCAALGAGGLDTGTLAADTWYAIYAAASAADGALSGLTACISTSLFSPSLVGYTHFVRLGMLRTDSSGNKYPLAMGWRGNRAAYKVVTGSNVTGIPDMITGVSGSTTTPTWTGVAWANFAPPTATVLHLMLRGTVSGTAMVAPNDDFGAFNSTTNPPPAMVSGSNVSSPVDIQPESTNIYYAASHADNGLYITGWTDNIYASFGQAPTESTSLATQLAADSGAGLIGASHDETYPTGTLGDRFRVVVYATDAPFNAVADGTTDDRAAIQAAIDFVASLGGGAVMLPAGRVRINSALTISTPRIAIIGAGAGATRLLLGTDGQNGINLDGADVHSIEIAHLQIENVDSTPSGGYMIAFKSLTILDVKIHHITTFYAYYAIGTDAPETGGSFVLDVTISDFEFRDCRFRAIKMVSAVGWKISRGAISFADPQSTQPAASSACIYLGDWTDGFWISDLNVLGGENSIDFGSEWASSPRKPAQGTLVNVAADSGWDRAFRFRACKNIELIGCRAMNLAGGVGQGAGFTNAAVDGVFWLGGQVCNNQKNGVEIGAGTRIYFKGTQFVSNSRSANATYHGAYVTPGRSYFGFYDCLFYNDTGWFGANGQGYGLFIDSGCTHYEAVENKCDGNVTGGIFDGSAGSNSVVANNSGYGFGSATYDPPSLADGAGATTTVSCGGARLGDAAFASFSIDTQGITVTAWVSASDVVSVRFQNETGGTLDIASGTLRVWIERRR